jgi:SEC-C motif-containing protein
VVDTFRGVRGSTAWIKLSGESEEALRGDARCACGGSPPGATFDECCGPLLRSERHAETAEQLMRSRYTAYALADGEHLFRTWYARTRPERVDPEPWVRWVALEIVDTRAGQCEDDTGVVEFRAHWVAGEGAALQQGELHERSTFQRRGGRWLYVGPQDADEAADEAADEDDPGS